MSKQNQEYFQARRTHEENVSPKAWLKIIPIMAILVGIMVWAVNRSDELGRQRADEEVSNIDTRINESNRTTSSTKVKLENLGLSVELHEGLKYDYSMEFNLLTAISQDSDELAYVIGEIPKSMQKKNMKELWMNMALEKDPNITFRDSLDQIIAETSQNGKAYKGILVFQKINDKRIFLNSVSLKSRFEALEPKMNVVFNSIKVE